MTDIDWAGRSRCGRRRARWSNAYAPYSGYPVGAAALVDDGRIVSGCNVENASYGVTLCAECGLVSALAMSGGGKLVAFDCVDGHGATLMPCGRCRQLLFEHSAEGMVLEHGVRDPHHRRSAAGCVRTADTCGLPRRGRRLMVEPFDAVDLIRTKRDGGALSGDQLRWLVDAYTRGYVADEQMSAMTMAIFLNGMGSDEIRDLTLAMVASGDRLDFSGLAKPTTDKHSTGGVGDKITLPLAPLVATFGAAVPQLSGRGLGHTGGTLDKLESIPGWRAKLSNREFMDQLGSVGAVVCAAGADLAPADGKLYALRDITGTVEAIPLIASSIMSKKIAEGTAALVLDVKFGSGAFMQDPVRSRELAETMVRLGNDAGVATRALLTDMNVPLGHAIGNANEVRESVDVLGGGGPADVVELTVALAREMLDLAGIRDADVASALDDGRAMDTWRAMIRAQGGDPDAPLPVAKETHVVTAASDGVLVRPGGAAVRDRRLAAGRRPRPQGGPGGARRRHRPARQTGRCDPGRTASVHALGRRSGPLRARARGARGRLRARSGRHGGASSRVDHRPHRLRCKS